jgi:ABC-2 type transport system permease protein
MLSSYGINVEQSMVLDQQNDPIALQVSRQVSGMTVQEIQALDYPFFISVRQSGMDQRNPILSKLSSLTVSWASPVIVDKDKNANRKVTTLFKSSSKSWTSTDTNVQPDPNLTNLGFPVGSDQQSYPLAVVVEGSFDSFFKGKPLTFDTASQTDQSGTTDTTTPTTPAALVESSPDTARLIVVGSSEFLNDTVFQLSSNLSTDNSQSTLQFIQNAVDWATEDTDLLSIRSRGASARVIDALSDNQQKKWEVLNYAVALIGLIVLGGVWQWRKRAERPMPLVLPQSAEVSTNG